MAEKAVLMDKHAGGITVITLNRPAAANALSLQLLYELHEAISAVRFDKTVRCVILTGAGDKVFCAGADLKERAGMTPVQVRQTLALIRHNINDLETLPQPVIAAVNGAALGGGTELALACDLRVASEQAKFGLTETTLGIIPGAGGTQRLPRLIGKGRAKELIYTGRRVDAAEAFAIGLAEHVVPAESVMTRALDIARLIVKNAPVAVAQAKFAIDKGYDTDLHTALAIEQNAYEITLPTRDRIEGLQAFKEKRAPEFTGE